MELTVLAADFTKAFPGGTEVAAAFQLTLGQPGLTVLFGPSGCGKTTVLRCLAGLERPDRGWIRVGAETWSGSGRDRELPACRRGIGYVFQETALFPHLSVAGNIAYGLAGWTRSERRARVAELVRLVGLDGCAERHPQALSGGQKQRVALARALAPRPRLMLLDEPFASLDRAAAEQLRHSLRKILQALGVPAVLVTHDVQEALALGDRMLLMTEGRIVQDGAPAEVLSVCGAAARAQVGEVLRARVAGRVEGLLRLAVGSAELYAPDPGGEFLEAYACIRAEGVALELGAHGPVSQRNQLTAVVRRIEPQGALQRVFLDAGMPLEALITTWARDDLRLEPGMRLQALIKATAIQVIPIER
jgi:molybdate transport system ATP-binding protein